LCRIAGAHPIAVVSNGERADYARSLGATGVIDRTEFDCWRPAPDDPAEQKEWLAQAKAFGRAIRAASPEGADVDIVFEHPGRNTLGVSAFVVASGGMVVFCAATTGYDFQFDARHVWMRQKRIQGSHYASLKEAAEANRLVIEGRCDPCLSRTFAWNELPEAHQLMLDNRHPPGNMAVLIQAAGPGLGRRGTA
jgi:crotonyl-CoA carboxylase/reductase